SRTPKYSLAGVEGRRSVINRDVVPRLVETAKVKADDSEYYFANREHGRDGQDYERRLCESQAELAMARDDAEHGNSAAKHNKSNLHKLGGACFCNDIQEKSRTDKDNAGHDREQTAHA